MLNQDINKPFGELWFDIVGEPHFLCHSEGEDFLKLKGDIQKFISLLQKQLDEAKNCPFYVEEV